MEEELALLEPDLATLISRGDSLVLQVQTLDMDWALRINATTAQLRAGRSSLKARHEVCPFRSFLLLDGTLAETTGITNSARKRE